MEILADSLLPNLYPYNKLSSNVKFIVTYSSSVAIKNIKGEKESSCLNPHSRGNLSVKLPFTSTEAVAVDTHPIVHFLHNNGNSIYS